MWRCAGNKRFPTDRGIKKGGKGISHPRGEFTHTGYQEGWERDFPPTGGVLTHGGSSHTHGVSRGVGKGVPTHGGSSHTRGIKKGGKGISHPRGEFSHTGYQEGWEREFPPTGGVHTHGVSRGVGKGFPTHGGSSHTGGVHTHGVSRRVGKGFPTHGVEEGWEREFSPTGFKKGGKGISPTGCEEGWEREFHTRGDFPPTGGCHSRVTWYKSPVVQSKLPKLFFKLHLALPTGPGEGSVYSGWFVGAVGIFVLLSHGWHRCRCRLRGV